MAEAVVSLAIENVGKLVIENAQLLTGLRDKVDEMQAELKWMQCFLEDADKRQGDSLLVRNLISEIKDAAYDAEDVIESFVLTSALRNRQEGFVNSIMNFVKHVLGILQVGSKIEAIKTRLSKLRDRLQTYGIIEIRGGGEGAGSTESSRGRKRKRQDYPHVVDQYVVGLDHKITEIVDHLLDVGQKDHPVAACISDSVICISGMGGLGKTTLAKQVYGDSRVRGHFEGFAWVYISQQFREKDTWESILSQLSGKSKETMQGLSNDELASQLFQVLKQKRCLVVIDDIWSSEAWNELSAAFPYTTDGSKSKILMTTRKKIASRGVYYCGLNILDDTNSSKLIINAIQFLGGPYHPIKDSSTLKQHASEMVKQCAGLPLAITVLGGILATKHELKEWERVGDNIRLSLNEENAEEDKGVSSVLETSYYDLPYNLKSCFLYLSQYPEDHEIRSTQLIQRWIGEGFLVLPENDKRTMEHVGDEYLNDLVSRCMIQVGKRSCTGRVKTCRLHDLMRELCIKKATQENFMHFFKDLRNETTQHDLDKTCNIRRMHMFIQRNIDLPISFGCDNFSQLRSLLWLSDDFVVDSDFWSRMCFFLEKLKFCRVLVIEFTYDENTFDLGISHTVSMDIAHLLHLRYLCLNAKCNFSKLWSLSMSNLSSLQTLDLRCGGYPLPGSFKLPNSIWMMEQLRHLYLPRLDCECESRNPRVGSFRNLQTLVNFPPRNFDLQQNLVKFTNVRKLVLYWQKEMWEVILLSKKLVFTRLQSLSLSDGDLEAITTGCPNLEKLQVVDGIAASTCLWPSKLTKLVLRSTELDANNVEALGKLQGLKILFLQWRAVIAKEMIFHENDFPQLQHLQLDHLYQLEEWTVHEGALPVLSRLEIVCCRKLKSLPAGFQNLKQLKEIEVKSMPYSFKKRLESGGDEWRKVPISFSGEY